MSDALITQAVQELKEENTDLPTGYRARRIYNNITKWN
jgi:hypothetical protein